MSPALLCVSECVCVLIACRVSSAVPACFASAAGTAWASSLLAPPSSPLCPLEDSPTLEVGKAGRQGTRRSALIPSWSCACGGNGGGDESTCCWRGFAGGCSSPGDSSWRAARKRKIPLPSTRTAKAGPTAGLARWFPRHMGALGSSRDMGATDMLFPSGSKPGPGSALLLMRFTTPSPLVSTSILSACMTACALELCGATLPMNKAGLCEVLCVSVVCTGQSACALRLARSSLPRAVQQPSSRGGAEQHCATRHAQFYTSQGGGKCHPATAGTSSCRC